MIADWIKEWALVISGGVTFLLAVAAFLAIWQNRSLQKRERKERLLNEIIEWMVDTGKKCQYETDPQEPKAKQILEEAGPSSTCHDFLTAHRPAFECGFSEVRWKIEYMRVITKEFDDILQKKMRELIDQLTNHLTMLQSQGLTHTGEELKKVAGEIVRHNLKLTELTKEVMKEVGKIKAKLVS